MRVEPLLHYEPGAEDARRCERGHVVCPQNPTVRTPGVRATVQEVPCHTGQGAAKEDRTEGGEETCEGHPDAQQEEVLGGTGERDDACRDQNAGQAARGGEQTFPRASRATVSTAPVATAAITAAFVDSTASAITNTTTGTVE